MEVMEEFKIYKEKEKQIIERLEYPRFRGEITFSSLSDIENIKMLDTCNDAVVVAKALRQAGDYIIKNSR